MCVAMCSITVTNWRKIVDEGQKKSPYVSLSRRGVDVNENDVMV